MRIAFYAPLKAPDHPVASGDRQLARQLLHALAVSGHEVGIASRLRTFDGVGDAARQARLGAIGRRLAARWVARRRGERAPQLWFTYHLHHKAPDVLGPHVCEALGIPYVVAEASVAPKQREGRWSVGYAQSLAALRVADAVVFVNPVDVDEVLRVRGDVRHVVLRPFIDVERFAAIGRTRGARDRVVRLVTVAMMREGAKLASYRLLAAALQRLVALDWQVTLVGDGAARAAVEAAFAPLPSDRVRFAGARSESEVARLLHDADVFVWPAIDEAFGMALVEAQACGLPVVAGDSPGVASVVEHDASGFLVPVGDVEAIVHALQCLVVDDARRRAMGERAVANMRARHDVSGAAAALDRLLHDVAERRRHRC